MTDILWTVLEKVTVGADWNLVSYQSIQWWRYSTSFRYSRSSSSSSNSSKHSGSATWQFSIMSDVLMWWPFPSWHTPESNSSPPTDTVNGSIQSRTEMVRNSLFAVVDLEKFWLPITVDAPSASDLKDYGNGSMDTVDMTLSIRHIHSHTTTIDHSRYRANHRERLTCDEWNIERLWER